MVLSRDPDTIWRLSAENATLNTSFVCPWKQRTVAPVFKSQRRSVLSQEPDKANCPSEDKVTAWTVSEWPQSAFRAYPQLSASGVSSQTMTFLSLEAETIKLLCSYVAAMAVTQ